MDWMVLNDCTFQVEIGMANTIVWNGPMESSLNVQFN
jgi:hypothetical protein